MLFRSAIQTVKSNDKIKVLSIRTASFETSSENGNAELVKLDKDSENNLSKWIEDKVDTSDRPELTSAKVVVSGGRGVGSEENFKIIEKLAGKLWSWWRTLVEKRNNRTYAFSSS